MKDAKDKKFADNAVVTANATSDIAVDEDSGIGSIQISNNVIASIVKKYALEVPGVLRFAPQGLVGDIADMLSKRSYDRNIVIELGEGTAVISLTLNMEFGIDLVAAAQTVQNVLIEKVKAFTGIEVKKVNVLINSIEEPAPAVLPESEEAKEGTREDA